MKWNNTHTVISIISGVFVFGGLTIYLLTSQHYLQQQLQAAQEEKDHQREQQDKVTNAVTNLLPGNAWYDPQTLAAQRRSDVNTILNAVYQYAVDHNGNFPSSIPTGEGGEICRSNVSDCTDFIDLSVLQKYLNVMPIDPQAAYEDYEGTGYGIFIGYVVEGQGFINDEKKITVFAPGSAGSKPDDLIFVTR